MYVSMSLFQKDEKLDPADAEASYIGDSSEVAIGLGWALGGYVSIHMKSLADAKAFAQGITDSLDRLERGTVAAVAEAMAVTS